jgi:hypothetical protein
MLGWSISDGGMVAQSQARTSAGTRECQAPYDLMRDGIGMSPKSNPASQETPYSNDSIGFGVRELIAG